MSRLFISMERLEAWTAEGRASLEGDRMTLTELNRAFDMKPAVHFVKVSGQDTDPNDLLGRVKSKEALEELGGELLGNSVIVHETAYEVVEGFVGEPLPP
ncbi:MAG TPA: hypothetical protein VLB44_23415 [Kofleriaceae bacterium]|nr:hypothetical protein [Kofleriaceae bacterium]